MDRRTALKALAALTLFSTAAKAAQDPPEPLRPRSAELTTRFRRICHKGTYADEDIWRRAPSLQDAIGWDPYTGVADMIVEIQQYAPRRKAVGAVRYWYTTEYCVVLPITDETTFEMPLSLRECEDLLGDDDFTIDEDLHLGLWRTDEPWDQLGRPFGYFSWATNVIPDDIGIHQDVDGLLRLRLTADCRFRVTG